MATIMLNVVDTILMHSLYPGKGCSSTIIMVLVYRNNNQT